jgi:hypothetical protein
MLGGKVVKNVSLIRKKTIYLKYISELLDSSKLIKTKIIIEKYDKYVNFSQGVICACITVPATLQLHYSYITAALRLHCGCILELRMHYLHFSAAKFWSIDPSIFPSKPLNIPSVCKKNKFSLVPYKKKDIQKTSFVQIIKNSEKAKSASVKTASNEIQKTQFGQFSKYWSRFGRIWKNYL